MESRKGPVTICVINLKGGVGKSTISTLLSRHAFTNRKCDVLAVDLDPQANLSQSLMRGGYSTFLAEQRPSIVEIFNGYIPPTKGFHSPTQLSGRQGVELILKTGEKSLELIPSRFDGGVSCQWIGAGSGEAGIFCHDRFSPSTRIADQFQKAKS